MPEDQALKLLDEVGLLHYLLPFFADKTNWQITAIILGQEEPEYKLV
ncbi:MAG: hypothetical protein HYY99_00655 [Candidatus Colwellbacteria bacterium]|nr:hypothetical protein [Candidatus Colwellbacteria bacterium]